MNAETRDRARTAFAARALELDALLLLLEDFVQSSLGRRAVRELAPLEESDARDALERVREMQLLERAGDLPSLGGLTDPGPILEASHKRGLEESELAAAVGLLGAIERLGDWLERRAGDVPRLGALGAELPDTNALRERLARVVDERGKIMSEATPLLAKLRNEERDLSSRIDGTLRQIAGRSDVRNVLTDGRVHLRGGRHCLAVRAKSSGRVKGIVHDRSQSEQSVFVEPREVIPLANRLAEVRVEERRELSRILTELSHEISANAPALERAGELLGRLELSLVSIGFAAEYDARVPKIGGDPGAPVGMLLRQARHPLLIGEVREGRLERVVPIDLRLGDEFSMLIITGPNTGGKTLALKTAGLFALMLRLGLPVPCAEGSAIPFYDGIAADIGDEQEISQSLSTFSSHLVRICDGLARANPRVLVLLDELGGGTDPDEGAALGEALLERLLEKDVPTLVSTHLGRLKEFAFRHPRVENACAEFDLETLAPCYTLVIGVPGESAALVIARRYGLDDALVDRA
ncbi:MAG: endonuclease MutS2, partial [Planctomycetes bacterium]|nr:endonuclease MutS2 [Planctomycetota bacterium]